jgi:peptidoglycan/LPS O-acetylase OafA/YrhL
MVDLFFMLSGVGMMIGYGKRVHDKEISFKDFILRRLSKLYPLFIISTIIVFVLEFIYRHKVGETFIYPNYDIYHAIQNMLFLQYGILGAEFSFNAPSWCIPICLLCYCMFYFVIIRTKEYQSIIYKFLFTAVTGAALIASGLGYPILNSAVGRGVASFSIGVLITFVFEKRESFKSKKLGICCLIFLLASYLVLRFKSFDFIGHTTLSMTLGFGPMIIMSTLFIPSQNAFMRNPVLRFLGVISWDIYLFHFPVQCFIKILDVYMNLNINYSSRVTWVIYVTATIGVSSIYHYLLSKKTESFILNFFKIR